MVLVVGIVNGNIVVSVICRASSTGRHFRTNSFFPQGILCTCESCQGKGTESLRLGTNCKTTHTS